MKQPTLFTEIFDAAKAPQKTAFYLPSGEEMARRFLNLCQGDWTKAKAGVLKAIDRHRGLYYIRRQYCAAYVWLLLNEPTPRLLGPVPTVTSLHTSIFSLSK
jgi:hypothetical protein